ncbi:hypothetical protein KCP73_04560 [Salmonella enterica subsp. enterica]|nr:hypothetical protein KCP73_04560 [Salmonella enterica subsp. enterica]
MWNAAFSPAIAWRGGVAAVGFPDLSAACKYCRGGPPAAAFRIPVILTTYCE